MMEFFLGKMCLQLNRMHILPLISDWLPQTPIGCLSLLVWPPKRSKNGDQKVASVAWQRQSPFGSVELCGYTFCFERNHTQSYCNEFPQMESHDTDERNMAVRDLSATLEEYEGTYTYTHPRHAHIRVSNSRVYTIQTCLQ